MNSMTITKLYDQLSSKIGKETADSLVSFIEQKIREQSREDAIELMGKLVLTEPKKVPAEKKSWRLNTEDFMMLFVFAVYVTAICLLFAASR